MAVDVPRNGDAFDVEQAQLEEYMDVVRGVARAVARRLPPTDVDVEELEADGFEALVKALAQYEEAKGPLIPYIVVRCRGAMIDGLRRRMPISRTYVSAGRPQPAVVSLDSDDGDGKRIADTVADPTAHTTEEIAISRAMVSVWAARVAQLSTRHRRIFGARFLQRRTLADVAAAEGVSASAVHEVEKKITTHLRTANADAERDDMQRLSPKEATVLQLAADGATTVETAERLRNTLETVKAHRKRIIAKLHARNMVNAVAIAYQRGLLR